MPTLFASGSGTLTLDTPVAVSVNVAGTYILRLDLSALVAGDVLVIRAKARALTSGTTRLMWETSVEGVQEWPIWDSLPVPTDLAEANGVTLEFEQTDGTGRAVPYAVIAIA